MLSRIKGSHHFAETEALLTLSLFSRRVTKYSGKTHRLRKAGSDRSPAPIEEINHIHL